MNTLSDITSNAMDTTPAHMDGIDLNKINLDKTKLDTVILDKTVSDTALNEALMYKSEAQTYSVKSNAPKNGGIKLTDADTAVASDASLTHPVRQYLLAHPGTGNYEIANNIPSMSNCEVFNWLIDAVKSGEVNYELGKYSLIEK